MVKVAVLVVALAVLDTVQQAVELQHLVKVITVAVLVHQLLVLVAEEQVLLDKVAMPTVLTEAAMVAQELQHTLHLAKQQAWVKSQALFGTLQVAAGVAPLVLAKDLHQVQAA